MPAKSPSRAQDLAIVARLLFISLPQEGRTSGARFWKRTAEVKQLEAKIFGWVSHSTKSGWPVCHRNLLSKAESLGVPYSEPTQHFSRLVVVCTNNEARLGVTAGLETFFRSRACKSSVFGVTSRNYVSQRGEMSGVIWGLCASASERKHRPTPHQRPNSRCATQSEGTTTSNSWKTEQSNHRLTTQAKQRSEGKQQEDYVDSTGIFYQTTYSKKGFARPFQ